MQVLFLGLQMDFEWACLKPETWLGPNLTMYSEYCDCSYEICQLGLLQ